MSKDTLLSRLLRAFANLEMKTKAFGLLHARASCDTLCHTAHSCLAFMHTIGPTAAGITFIAEYNALRLFQA